jgi:8-oxo-dGTP pyrophosphatase MutT (NUDIX family)
MKKRAYRAAGGVVVDDAGRVLVIERDVVRDGDCRHEVRLPKGHVEAGEADAEAAQREVCEETGYCATEIVADLGEATTEFALDGTLVLRLEHYFLMRLLDPSPGRKLFDSGNPEEARFRNRWAAGFAEAEAGLTFDSERAFVARARAAATRDP